MTPSQTMPLRLPLVGLRLDAHTLAVAGIALGAFCYFLWLASPDLTWANVASDGPDYLIASKFLRIAHPTGEPLYTLLGAAWLRIIPFGSEYWRLALLSVIPAAATTALLYHATRSRLAPLVFAASGIVVSQATVVELYHATLFLMILSWHLHSQDKRAWAYAVLGLACGIHHWAAFMLIVLTAVDVVKHGWGSLKYSLLTVAVGAPWYLYIVFANRPPYSSISGPTLHDYMGFFFSQGALVGGVAVMGGPWQIAPDFTNRVLDFIRIVGSGFGVPALLLLAFGVRQAWRSGERLLPILTCMFPLHYLTNLDPHTYTYAMPAFAFGAVLLARAAVPWAWVKPGAYLVGIGLLALNALYYDIGGKFTDPNLTATQFYKDLDTVPNGSVLWSKNRGWERTTTEWYMLNNPEREIDTILVYRPLPSKGEIWRRFQQAEAEGKLFRTELVDDAHHVARIVPTDAEFAMSEMRQFSWYGRMDQGGYVEPEAQP